MPSCLVDFPPEPRRRPRAPRKSAPAIFAVKRLYLKRGGPGKKNLKRNDVNALMKPKVDGLVTGWPSVKAPTLSRVRRLCVFHAFGYVVAGQLARIGAFFFHFYLLFLHFLFIYFYIFIYFYLSPLHFFFYNAKPHKHRTPDRVGASAKASP